MGAMQNDLNRCTFMYSDDRRCRNLVEGPGSRLCYFHGNRTRKPPHTPPAEDGAVRAFFQWLATHPLDTGTSVNRALNVVLMLVAAGRLSIRRADSLLRTIRLLMGSVRYVRDEVYRPNLLKDLAKQRQQFLAEIASLLSAATAQDPPAEPAAECGSTPEVPGRQFVYELPEESDGNEGDAGDAGHASAALTAGADAAPARTS